MTPLPASKYQEVARRLLLRIESGELTGALPGVKQLALEYDVNFMTVDKAIRVLKEMAVVERIPRKGTYVRKQKTVAICVSDPEPAFLQQGFYAPFTSAVQNWLGQHNSLLFSENLHGKSERYITNLIRRIDGVILVSHIIRAIPEALAGIPKVIAMEVVDPESPIDHITYAGDEVGKLAADYLARQGCRRFAYIGSTGGRLFAARCQSFQHHAERLGRPALVLGARGEPDRNEITARLEHFRSLPERPDGIFCPTDNDAVFVGNWLWGNGIIPGRDVRIVGCNHDKSILAQALSVKPATIDLRLEEIGRAAAEQLCLRVDGSSSDRVVKIFPPKLIENPLPEGD